MFPIYQIWYCQFFNNCFVIHIAKGSVRSPWVHHFWWCHNCINIT